MSNWEYEKNKKNAISKYCGYTVDGGYSKKYDGVTLFYQESGWYADIFDINIEKGVKKVVFKNPKSNAWIARINIKNTEKTFPDVEELYIDETIDSFKAPNCIFPNVKKVCNARFGDRAFRNVFYSDADTVIDLTGFSSIDEYAFEGCKSVKIKGTEHVTKCAGNAFKNSAFSTQPLVNGTKVAGTILYDMCFDCDEIVIPENITCIADIKFPYIINRIRIKNTDEDMITELISKQIVSQSEVVRSIAFDEVVFDKAVFESSGKNDPVKAFDFIRAAENISSKCRNLIVDDNEMYKTVDGILYSADMKTLVLCPRLKVGKVTVPEGVECIKKMAFRKCNISGVEMPSSMRIIEKCAFMDCDRLSYVKLNDGLNSLGIGCFSYCSSLKYIDIPGTVDRIPYKCFDVCELEKVELHEGLKEIAGSSLDVSCGTITFPESLKRIETNNLYSVHTVYINGSIPSGLLDIIMNNNIKAKLSEIHTGNDVLYIPHVNCSDIMNILDTMEKMPLSTIQKNVYRLLPYARDIRKCGDIAVELYEKTSDINVHNKLRSIAKDYALSLLDDRNERQLVRLLKTKAVSPHIMKRLFEKIKNDDGMVVLTAYLIGELKDSNVETGFDI